MRTAAVLALALCIGCTGSDIVDGPKSDDELAECGLHAFPISSTECTCDLGYVVCPTVQEHCCADKTDFRMVVHSSVIRPTKEDGQPWDWDGDVPTWLIDLAHELSDEIDQVATSQTGIPAGTAAVTLLELTDRIAPELLAGTVPPDPYLWAVDDSDRLWMQSGYVSDTITPAWPEGFDVEFDGQTGAVHIEVWDSDLALDDFIGWLSVDLEACQLLHELGPVPVPGEAGVAEMTVEVRAR